MLSGNSHRITVMRNTFSIQWREPIYHVVFARPFDFSDLSESPVGIAINRDLTVEGSVCTSIVEFYSFVFLDFYTVILYQNVHQMQCF